MESFVIFKDSVPTTRKQAEEVRGQRQRVNPDPVMLQMGPFPATFAKFCEQGRANKKQNPSVWVLELST